MAGWQPEEHFTEEDRRVAEAHHEVRVSAHPQRLLALHLLQWRPVTDLHRFGPVLDLREGSGLQAA